MRIKADESWFSFQIRMKAQKTDKTIFYDYMREGWADEEDFFVDMTPEGDQSIFEQEFKNSDEFWKWYNS
jgi:hypothetical protein